MERELTHINEKDRPKMVDVTQKKVTSREAIASGVIKVSHEAFLVVKENRNKKGPVLQTAVIAAIMGVKKTSDLIPMCHPLMIGGVDVDIEELEDLPGFKIYVKVKVDGKTGVEMEALTGVSIGLLTIYDMLKAIDKSMEIKEIVLEKKSGGKSGDYIRKEQK
ncbi:MAG: cyclic pyranopterin monophosphate synthase MoaC [Epsilonproteobacteria bacterium]|nr:cyclic pyranopterin monophosphate synthase MoaC [Campylobacterota bacterium]